MRYRSDDPLFARYEATVTAVVAARGATLWAGPVLDRDPPGCARVLDRVVEHPVRAGRAAAMFWRNAATWGAEVAGRASTLIEPLRALEHADPDAHVMWELRQTVWLKRAGYRSAPRRDAGLLQHVGGHAELAPRAVGDLLLRRVGLRDLHEFLLEPAEVGRSGLHRGQLDLEVAPLLQQVEAGDARPRP